MANQIAGALESALLAQEAAEAARLDEELRVARDIQTALLPASPPQIAGWQLAADWRSARLVGGDFYDFWRLPQRGGGWEMGVGGWRSLSPQPPTPSLSTPGLRGGRCQRQGRAGGDVHDALAQPDARRRAGWIVAIGRAGAGQPLDHARF